MTKAVAALIVGFLALAAMTWVLTAKVVRGLRRRLQRSSRRALRRFRVRLNRSKLSPKHVIREQLMRDDEVLAAILAHAKETGEKLGDAEQRAELYIDEIVPSFGVFWYYVFGHLIAGLGLKLLYKLDLAEPGERLSKEAHGRNAVVYIANHRSNVDYVLMSYALTGQVALSYAVGEWARVWPLEGLFKAFGSYFIRRGYREELYHTVLRRYVQLITRQGITQGVFIEGGLSRDGWLRPAKVGMLDYLTQALREPGFPKEDILFVPVGLNYDRVLEDRPLTNEHLRRTLPEPETGESDRPGRGGRGSAGWRRRLAQGRRTSAILFKNLHRYWTRRLRKHGVAAVRYGEPISFRSWCERRGEDVLNLPRSERLAAIASFGEELLDAVGRSIPATPVTTFCAALEASLKPGQERADEQDVREQILKVLMRVEAAGGSRAPEGIDREQVLRRGRDSLALRRVIEDRDEELRVAPETRILVRYYAASLGGRPPEAAP